MSYRLRTPLSPEPGESLAGLIARNAAKFRFRQPKTLLHRINPPSQVIWSLCDTDPEQEFGRRLRGLLGIDAAAEFRKLSPWTGDPTSLAIMGRPVWRELLSLEPRTACPLCLQENLYHRSIWFVRAMPICAVHGVWLHNKCHVCQRPFSWHNSAHHLCSRAPACGADVRQAPTDVAPRSALRTMQALHALAHDADPGTGPLGLAFGDALKVSFLLGQMASFERTSRPPGFMHRHGAEVPDVVARGWDALNDWPHGFHRLLDGLRERASERRGKSGLRKAFGALSARVYHWAREPWGAPIGEAFANYAASQGDLATTARTLRRYAPGAEIRHRFITTAEAQRALGISPSSILRLARRRGLYELAPQGAGVPSLMRADTFRQILEEAKDSLLPDEARLELGVGRKVMEQLEANGLIRRLPPSDLVLESKPFRRAVIVEFVAACTLHRTKLTKEEARQRRLCTVVSATAPGRTVPDICRALVDGRLRLEATVPTERGLMKARLYLAEVDRVLPSTKETLSLLDAAKQIGIKYPSIHHWVKRGLLETTRSNGVDERGLRITREAWDRFLAEYVTSKMLARELGQRSNHWVSRHLRFLGVKPVSGETVDGGQTMLFRRSDVGPTTLKAVRRIQKGIDGTPQEKHRRSFSRVKAAAEVVAHEWGATFTRGHNLFTDVVAGTALQVITGRRPDITGVFVFHARSETLEALGRHPNPWVALVPNEGGRFLLVPADKVPWRGQHRAGPNTRFLSLKFDGRGRALDLPQYERSLPEPSAEPMAQKRPRTRRAFDNVLKAAARVEDCWGTKLEGNRNAFWDPDSGRKLHVICGRSCGGPTKQIFNIRSESFERLDTPDSWVALVPDGGAAFVLAPVSALSWSGRGKPALHVRVRFDGRGLPMGMWAGAKVIPLTYGGACDN